MNVVQGIKGLPPDVKPSCATVGVFDGVHVGHQALLGRVVTEARARGATPVVVTFDRHPLELIAPGKEPPLITTLRQRAEVLEQVGIEILLVLRFDEALRSLTPEEFVDRILVEALGVVHMVVGANFRFGRDHAGSAETLADLGSTRGFTVEVFSLVGGGEAISSSLIRSQLADGKVEEVATELGRPFRIEAHVVKGAGRGRALGIPTANLEVPAKILLPKLGVYAGWMQVGGGRYKAVTNIGFNPTFEERDRPIVEVHAIDFPDRDLYSEVVGVEFTHRLRDEKRFPDADSLVAEIRRDIERALALLAR